jgi:amidase
MQDTLGAFVPGVAVHRARPGAGLLSGLTFGAKDLFDVAGLVTGCGNPDWAATHEPAQADAWAVDALLEAGATLIGKTITDEISLGLLGINRFYGTPQNPRSPDRVPGGSRAAPPLRSRAAWSMSLWGATRAARCASRQASAAFTACGRPASRPRA